MSFDEIKEEDRELEEKRTTKAFIYSNDNGSNYTRQTKESTILKLISRLDTQRLDMLIA